MLGAKSKYRPGMCEKVIELMSEGNSKEAVSAKLGIGRTAFYDWCNPDSTRYKPEFVEAVNAGMELGLAFWEDELKKAALGLNPDANATLMIFNMKNRFREQWSDTQTVNHNIKQSAEDLSDDELAAIASSGGASKAKES